MKAKQTTNERIRSAMQKSGKTRVEFARALNLPVKRNSQKQMMSATLDNWLRPCSSKSFREAPEQTAMLAEIYADASDYFRKLYFGKSNSE